MLKDTVQLTEFCIMSHNRSISVSTVGKTSIKQVVNVTQYLPQISHSHEYKRINQLDKLTLFLLNILHIH